MSWGTKRGNGWDPIISIDDRITARDTVCAKCDTVSSSCVQKANGALVCAHCYTPLGVTVGPTPKENPPMTTEHKRGGGFPASADDIVKLEVKCAICGTNASSVWQNTSTLVLRCVSCEAPFDLKHVDQWCRQPERLGVHG